MGGDSNDLSETRLPTARLIAGASVAGASHDRAGLGCQDRFAFRYLGQSRYALAVADGLGSASHSDVGAWVAVNEAMAALTEADDLEPGAAAEAMMHAARRALECRAEDGLAMRDLACTLLVFVGDDGRGAAAHVGDGAAVGEAAGELIVISPPGESEYANEVTPLTADGWERYLRVSETFEDVRSVVLFSDGCQRAALRREEGWVPHGGFFIPLLEYLGESEDPERAAADIAALLGGAKIGEHSDDDKTLVAAVATETWR